MEFSRPEYLSGQPLPSPGDLSNPGIKPRSPELQEDFLPAEPQGKPKNTGVGSLLTPSPADLPGPGIEPGSPALQANSLPTELSGKPGLAWVKKNFKKPFSWWFFSCSLFLRVTTLLVCSLVLYHCYDLFLFLPYTSSTFFSSSLCLLPVKLSDSGASQRCGQVCMGFIRGGLSSDSVSTGKVSC